MIHHSLKHYTIEHYDRIQNACTYEELYIVAMEILNNMPKPIIAVCGPISSGGTGNVVKNLEIFEKTIHKLSDQQLNVFNQMPLEKKMGVLLQKIGKSLEEKNQILLEKFYLPLYESGLIAKLYFIYGWESSNGSRWEREVAKKNNIPIEDLPKDFHIELNIQD